MLGALSAKAKGQTSDRGSIAQAPEISSKPFTGLLGQEEKRFIMQGDMSFHSELHSKQRVENTQRPSDPND